MSFSRRKFMQQSTLAALACAGGWRAWETWDAPVEADDTNPAPVLTRSMFEGALGSTFTTSAGGDTAPAVGLVLAAVNDLPALVPVDTGSMTVQPPQSTQPPVSTTGFVLSFTGDPSQPLDQGTYTFTNGLLGTFQMFIVPDGQGLQTYSVVFNQVQG
jgi:hypothetical protein